MTKVHPEFKRVYDECRNDIFRFTHYMGFKPTWQQAEILQAVKDGHKYIAVKSGQGPGKCLCVANSFWYNVSLGIRDDFATYTTRRNQTMAIAINCLENLTQTVQEAPGDADRFYIPSMTEATQQLGTHKATAFPSGVKKCVRLAVDSGQWLDLSTDHPVYTARGWVHASEINTDDLIAMPRRLPAPLTELEISDSEVRVVAALLCDGGISTEGKVNMTHLPNAFLDLFIEDVKALGGGITVAPSASKAVTLNISKMLPITRRWGIQGHLSKDKRVPAQFYGLSQRQLGIFFNTIFACDGYVDKDGFAIGLASESFIQDIQTLLLRFGVHSRYAFKKARCGDKAFPSWRLTVSGRENINKLTAAMGLPVGREMQTRAMWDTMTAEANTNVDIVPIRVPQFNEMMRELGASQQRGRRHGTFKKHQSMSWFRSQGFRARNTSYWSRQKFVDFCEQTCYSGKYRSLATNDIFWVRVVSVEPIGQREVFDMNVPDTGNFVANNLIVHNTAVSVMIGLWRAFRRYKACTVITAPTMRQCKDVWLKEARLWNAKAHPAIKASFTFQLTKAEVLKDPDWGIKLFTSTSTEAAQGYHNEFLSVIMEEASGVPREIVEQVMGTLSNPDMLFLQIGNPNTRDCAFFDCFNRQRDHWKTLTLNAEDTARDYPHIVSPTRNKRLEKEYGRNSNVYRVRVLGEFPQSDPDAVLSSEEVEKVICRSDDHPNFFEIANEPRKPGKPPARQISIDFARFGGDESTIFKRQGNVIAEWRADSFVEPYVTLAKAIEMQRSSAWSDDETWFVPDANGMGESMMYHLYQAGKHVKEFKNQCRALKSEMYADIITEAWFHFRNLVREKKCLIPDDNLLIKQLCGRRYTLDARGRIKIESKDDYKARNDGQSPDRAEALVMVFYDDVESSMVTSVNQNNNVRVAGR